MTDLVQSVFVSRIDETIGDDDQPDPIETGNNGTGQHFLRLSFDVNFRKNQTEQ